MSHMLAMCLAAQISLCGLVTWFYIGQSRLTWVQGSLALLDLKGDVPAQGSYLLQQSQVYCLASEAPLFKECWLGSWHFWNWPHIWALAHAQNLSWWKDEQIQQVLVEQRKQQRLFWTWEEETTILILHVHLPPTSHKISCTLLFFHDVWPIPEFNDAVMSSLSIAQSSQIKSNMICHYDCKVALLLCIGNKEQRADSDRDQTSPYGRLCDRCIRPVHSTMTSVEWNRWRVFGRVTPLGFGEPQPECWMTWALVGFGLVSLFNGISTFVGYLMPKPFS